ncbi:hypothetical protein MLD38_018304 [Melastoma candidum]|uniref:Uncharacterized protein n=1 Tax=Melastoma candidum TaxID=119954 RepID=A0ACB9QTE7_9MYRT|nr:hypothetical protein MLD38_018304 [Melastoma candidum]
MAYEDDPYRDEDGEPLMDYDDIQSDGEQPQDPQQQQHDHFLDDNLEDDIGEEDGGGGNWTDWDQSQIPSYDPEQSKGKPRKRLVKKGAGRDDHDEGITRRVDDFVEDDVDGFLRESSEERRLKRKKEREGSSSRKEMRGFSGGGGSSSKGENRMKSGSLKKRPMMGRRNDGEVKEMWDTIAGGDSEDDQEGLRTMDDDNFIDDSGVDPAERYYSDEPRSPGEAPQAEEDEEIKQLFRMGKKKKKSERSPAEIALLVEKIIAELELAADMDADANRQGKPAINKLKKLPLLTDVLSKRQLQQEFLDHGVLALLKTWLEPLPDKSLPNINIRAAILQTLSDLPIDLEQYDRREQLKSSGIGKVIMFLSKSDEETTSNRKLAKDLVDKWSRPIFNKSTRFEDMRHAEDERIPNRRPPMKRPAKETGTDSGDRDLDMDVFSRERKPGQSSSRLHASRPEATPLDFVVRPQSKIDPDEIRARAKLAVQDQRRMKMNKKLQQLKAPKKKQLQATKLSVEGRGMTKYL